ncbi:small heat shock protein, chloroplastic-like [Tasmannia lanceolata]|uniref:small heat shock protein, chloroplastic-like n=1 Tax=Tasmannia lanceolata TaxID=3420 RepID=UPI004062E2E8
MSSSISNLSFSLPLLSKRSPTQKPFRFPPLLKPIGRNYYTSIKAMGAGGTESLDHFQKANRQQPQPKKRVAPVTPLGIWDRFPTARTVQQMMDTMERIMEDPLSYPSLSEDNGVSYRRGRTPWEIKEGEQEFKMRFDMPGMTKKDVKVWVEEKMLVVRAEKMPMKNPQGKEEEEEWSSKSYGRYSSRIALPDNIEMEKIKAEVKDGVLYITIPKGKTSSRVLDIDVE